MIIRNQEVQGGRQIRFCQFALQSGIMRNCSNSPQGHIWLQPRDASSPKSTSQLTFFLHFFFFFFEDIWIVFVENCSRPIFKHAVVPDGFRLEESRPAALLIDNSVVRRGVLVRLGMGWFGGVFTR